MAKLKSEKELQQKKKATALHQEKKKAHTDGFEKKKKEHSTAKRQCLGEGKEICRQKRKKGGTETLAQNTDDVTLFVFVRKEKR